MRVPLARAIRLALLWTTAAPAEFFLTPTCICFYTLRSRSPGASAAEYSRPVCDDRAARGASAVRTALGAARRTGRSGTERVPPSVPTVSGTGTTAGYCTVLRGTHRGAGYRTQPPTFSAQQFNTATSRANVQPLSRYPADIQYETQRATMQKMPCLASARTRAPLAPPARVARALGLAPVVLRGR
jgi:hypothetical protein